jgi:hypothetical protein
MEAALDVWPGFWPPCCASPATFKIQVHLPGRFVAKLVRGECSETVPLHATPSGSLDCAYFSSASTR